MMKEKKKRKNKLMDLDNRTVIGCGRWYREDKETWRKKKILEREIPESGHPRVGWVG